METTYLYYIAIISTSYVSFTSFFLALRQIVGSKIDGAAGWLMRYLIAGALCITVTALLPALLALFAVDATTSVRASSLVAAVLLTRLDFIYLRKRSSVLEGPMDFGLRMLFAWAVLADAVFCLCGFGIFTGHDFAAFCAAETLELIVMFQYFTRSLERLMREPGRHARASPA